MLKNKFGFWFVSALVLGFCVNLLASNRTSNKIEKSTKVMNGNGAIEGQIIQQAGGTPVAGVRVTVQQLDCPSNTFSDSTDVYGFYFIWPIPPGNYKVYTDNDSVFLDVYWDNKVKSADADTVLVVSGEWTENIDFSLREGGEITGTVSFNDAFYVMANVCATSTDQPVFGDDYCGSAQNFMGTSATYVIKRLPTGTYKVRTGNSLGYFDVYYDDKWDSASADLVSVTEGSTTSSVDFTLTRGGEITGTITSEAKSPLEGIYLGGFDIAHEEWTTICVTMEDGYYATTGLGPGYWKVLAYGDTTYAFAWWDNKATWDEADAIWVIPPFTNSGIDFTLEIGGSISGHVYDLQGAPLSGWTVVVYDTSFYFWRLSKLDLTSADGSYRIGGLRTGYYRLAALDPCYQTQIWYNNKFALDDADSVHVTMPNETTNIDFYLSTSVENEDEITQRPTEFELFQNYPNPFNLGTRIEYVLKRRGHVTLHIYNILGERVKTLLDQDQPIGFYQISWDGKDDKGKSVSSGLYFYRLEINGFSQAKRMLLLK
jgi:hypothetical protein